MSRPGFDRLWGWFSLSYAGWLTLPRVLMHEMPDEWQDRMAALLEEWDETWDTDHMPVPQVQARDGNRFTRWPAWLTQYRHPDRQAVAGVRRKQWTTTPSPSSPSPSSSEH